MKPITTNSGGWSVSRITGKVTPRQGMLDKLLRGGLMLPPPAESRDGLIILIRGQAGTGKSTLALQLAANLAAGAGGRKPGRPRQGGRHFLSLEQDQSELRAIYCRMVAHQCRANGDLQTAAAVEPRAAQARRTRRTEDELLRLLGQSRKSGNARGLVKVVERVIGARRPPQAADIEKMARHLGPGRIHFNEDDADVDPGLKEHPLSRAYRFVERFGPGARRGDRPILIIDGLSILAEGERARLEMRELIEALRQRCLIGVIAYEPSGGSEDNLDHQVDLVIELEERHLSDPIDYIVHELHFKKSRYQDAALGWHQYKIRGFGLEIYPSVHFQVHTHLYMARQLGDSLVPIGEGADGVDDEPENRWSAIERILGGIKPGDSVALLGPRGAFKTTLVLDFLFRSHRAACPPRKEARDRFRFGSAEHGLLVSIIDNEEALRRQRSCPLGSQCGARHCFADCRKHMFLFYQRPGCISSSEFIYYLKTRLQIAPEPIRRLAFWDLTQLEHRFPLLANDPMFIPALLDVFKMRSSSGYVGSKVKSVFMGAANARLSTAIAAVADNVIFCWRDRIKAREQRAPKSLLEERLNDLRSRFMGGLSKRAQRRFRYDPLRSDYLMLYVDRTSGSFGKEMKSLFALPISAAAELLLPEGRWRAEDLAIPPDLIPKFEQAEAKILHVTEMQGFGHETIRDDGAVAAQETGRNPAHPPAADAASTDRSRRVPLERSGRSRRTTGLRS